jgi:HlyD family secretion protein
VLLLAAAIAFALWPRPLPVDLATATVAPLRATIEEEGVTRVREVYTVYSPLEGYLLRIDAEAGDAVEANVTELARIEPSPPAFLDVRTAAEQEAAVEAARAARDLAAAEVDRAKAELDFAEGELDRAQRLIRRDAISQRSLDDAERRQRVANAELATAEATLTVREFELRQAETRLLSREEIERYGEACECVPVTAPVSGVVLRVLRESAGVVSAGAPLVDIGDPGQLEVAVDLLSEDAVQVSPGQKAYVSGWGGPELSATVRRVEPFGRTEISALGIEEQRVDVVLDLDDPPERWNRLGHGFRVDVDVVVFEGEVLQVPLGALFRAGDDWAVFTAEDGVALQRAVTVGVRSGLAVEIRDGLADGQEVILYPAADLEDGARITQR